MLAAGPPAEFVAALAYPLPGETVFRFIGFPERTTTCSSTGAVTARRSRGATRPAPSRSRSPSEMLSYWRYCREFTADKRDHRGRRLRLRAARRPRRPSRRPRLQRGRVGHLRPVVRRPRGGDQPASATACTCLLPRRDTWAELCADPSLIPNAVEEVLRFESSQISWRRITTRDTTLGGLRPSRRHARSCSTSPPPTASPTSSPSPTPSTSTGPNAARHISFGKGIHYCLGANLAKLEAQLVARRARRADPVAAPGRADQDAHLLPEHHVPRARRASSSSGIPHEPVLGAEVPVPAQPRPGAPAGVPGRPPRGRSPATT